MCVVQPRSFATSRPALNIQPLKNVPSWSKNSSTSFKKKKKKFHHTESTTNHTSLISQTQQSSKPIFTQSKKFSTPVVVYSQHRGESRSFALTHAQGGELSLSLSRHYRPLITLARQGGASWHDREKILLNSFPFRAPFSHSSSCFFRFSFFPVGPIRSTTMRQRKRGKKKNRRRPLWSSEPVHEKQP